MLTTTATRTTTTTTTMPVLFLAVAKEAGDKVAMADAVAFVGAQGLLDCVEVAAAVVDGL